MKIILDVDGPIADTIPEVLRNIKEEYGFERNINDIYDYDLRKSFPSHINPFKYFKKDGFFYTLKPVEGAIKYIKKLSDDGDDIMFGTDAPMEGYVDKHIWIREYIPFISERNISMISRKDFLFADVMLDDSPANIENSICTYPVIFDRPWNRNCKGLRVHSWEEFYMFIQNLKNKQNVV